MEKLFIRELGEVPYRTSDSMGQIDIFLLKRKNILTPYLMFANKHLLLQISNFQPDGQRGQWISKRSHRTK